MARRAAVARMYQRRVAFEIYYLVTSFPPLDVHPSHSNRWKALRILRPLTLASSPLRLPPPPPSAPAQPQPNQRQGQEVRGNRAAHRVHVLLRVSLEVVGDVLRVGAASCLRTRQKQDKGQKFSTLPSLPLRAAMRLANEAQPKANMLISTPCSQYSV